MARKPRPVSLRLALPPEEAERLKAFASAQNLTVSEVLRRLAREAGGKGPTLDDADREHLMAIREEMRRLGVNLNQVARALNSSRVPDLVSVRDLVGTLLSELDTVDSFCAELTRRAYRSSVASVS